MAEYAISPPASLLIVLGVLVAVSIAITLVRRGSTGRKVVSLAIVVAVSVALGIVAYRPSTIAVSSEGVEIRGAGATTLAWAEITSAVFDANLTASEFRPTVRVRGLAVGGFRRGRFLLSNGNEALVYMEQGNAAVVLRTGGLTYVLAPTDVTDLAGAIDTYRVYE